MKKDFFTVLRFSWLLLVAVLAMPLVSYAQPTLVCNDNVQVSLASISDSGFCGELFPDAFLEQPADGAYTLDIGGLTYSGGQGPDQMFHRMVDGMMVVDFNQFAGPTKYTLSHEDGNSCWGYASFETNVLGGLTLGCAYVPPIHQQEEVTIKAGATTATFTLDATPMDCQKRPGAVEITAVGEAKYPCSTDPSGWCTVVCDATYHGGTNTVTVTIDAAAPVDVKCTIKVHAAECIDPTCLTWCPGAAPDASDIEKLLAGSCFSDPKQVFVNETSHGDQCEGLTTVYKYSAVFTVHGQDVLVDLGTEAYRVEPIHLYGDQLITDPGTASGVTAYVCNEFYYFNDDSEKTNFYSPDVKPTSVGGGTLVPATGSGILIMPDPSVTLNCGQDPNDLALTGQPLIVNYHKDVTVEACDATTLHYKVVTKINPDQPVQICPDDNPATPADESLDCDWIIVDVLEKEFVESDPICDCDDMADILAAYVGATGHADIGDIVEIKDPNGIIGADGKCDAAKLKALVNRDVVTKQVLTLEEFGKNSCATILGSHDDVGDFPACGGGRKFIRNWSMIDWCTGERKEHAQVIEVSDNTPPAILVKQADLKKETVSTQPWTCAGAIKTDGSGYFKDDCSEDLTINVEVTEKSTGIWVDPSAVGPGTYIVTYVAIDDCGNATKPIYREYDVVDEVRPVPVCEDELVVSITPDNAGDGGLAKIYAEDFNAGSHDAGCGPIAKMEVVRMEDWEVVDPPSCDPFTIEKKTTVEIDKFTTEEVVTEVGTFGPHVKFCCNDYKKDPIPVILRVYDAAGNHNDCMARVTVQNKLTTTLECQDYEVTCTEYTGNHLDYSPFVASASKCIDDDVVDVVDESINSCGVGVIKRIYVVAGAGSATCTSTITITAAGAFDPTTIRWPFHYDDNVYQAINKEPNADGVCVETGYKDVTLGSLNCGDDKPLCEPTWTDAACGLVGVSSKEDIIPFDDGACYKIIKRWTVVDWCTWEANGGTELDDENDTDRDVFEACENWCEGTEVSCDTYYFRYADDQVDVDGYYTFDQVIVVVDDVDPVFVSCEIPPVSLGADCTADITFSAEAADGGDCPSATITYSWVLTDADGAVVKSGDGASGAMSNLTAGVYTVTYTAADGCGNSATHACEIDIEDEKAPTPICYQSISTAVMAGDTPSVEIWASDYLKEGSDNCPGDLVASFSEDDATDTNRMFGCDDVTGTDMEMKVWLHDAAGNADYCYVTIRVDDNGHCGEIGSSAMIAGNIATEYGDLVAEADVMLNSVHPEFPAMRTTQNDGHYAFGGTPLTYDYEITADRDGDYMNGVSTLDLVLIQKHILGLTTLDSPYKVIAADINSDQKVTGADLVQLRQLILGVTDALPSNDSWRFVDAAQSFASNTTPWPFTEVIDVAGLSTNMMAEDFVGVKIGDVNANAQANSLMSAEVRSNGTLNLNIADATISAGDVISVDVTADNFSEVYGYQLTMNHTGLVVESVETGAIEMTDANVGIREGVLTMSWNNSEGVTTSEVLFTLNFRAIQDVQLSEVVNINSRITTAEAYVGAELANNDISLTFTDGENTIVATAYDLYQNEPNPFKSYTDVAFVLPNSGQATISVIDVTGKLVTTVKDQFNKGLNTVRFTKADLGAASGILYYKLESGEFTATKKMIVIE